MITTKDRCFALLAFGLYFAIGYGLIGFLPHYDSWTALTPVDIAIPFLPIFIIFYFAGDLYAFIPILTVQDKHRFREMMKGFFILMTIAFVCFIAIPIEMPKDVVYNDSWLSKLSAYQHTYDTRFNNFPSLHVAFTLYAWLILLHEKRKMALWTSPLVFLIISSVLLVKQHLFIDLIGGVALAAAVFWWWTTTLGESRTAPTQR